MIGFGDITDNTSALCSIAWLVYPGQFVNYSYIAPHDCQGFDLLTPSHYPPSVRTLNPPGVSYDDWIERLKFPEWKKIDVVGSIYPVDFRSMFKNDTSNVYSKEFIKFQPSNTFNDIRSTFPSVPYLLQSKKHMSPRCNDTNKERNPK